MKERKFLFTIIIILLIIIATIFVIKTININKESNKNENVTEVISNDTLTNKEKFIDDLKVTMESKTDKEVLIVNGEKIKQREIALVDFQINKEFINNSEALNDAISQTVKQYVILQDAEKRGITLTDNREKQIKESIEKSFQKNSEETNDLLDTFNMGYDDFLELYVDRTQKLEIISNWKIDIAKSINNGEVKIDNETFNNKYKEYKETRDNTNKQKILLELLEIYEQSLVGQATVEYVN